MIRRGIKRRKVSASFESLNFSIFPGLANKKSFYQCRYDLNPADCKQSFQIAELINSEKKFLFLLNYFLYFIA